MKKFLALILMAVMLLSVAAFAETAPVELSDYLFKPVADLVAAVPGMTLYDEFAATDDFSVYASFTNDDTVNPDDTNYISIESADYSLLGFVVGTTVADVTAALDADGARYEADESMILVYTGLGMDDAAYISFNFENDVVTCINLGHI